MTELIGSNRQIEWATKLRDKHRETWLLAFDNLRNAGASHELLDALDCVIATALEQRDASVWIDHRSGELYSIATKGRLLGALREKLDWSLEMEQLLGYNVFDKIYDYAV